MKALRFITAMIAMLCVWLIVSVGIGWLIGLIFQPKTGAHFLWFWLDCALEKERAFLWVWLAVPLSLVSFFLGGFLLRLIAQVKGFTLSL